MSRLTLNDGNAIPLIAFGTGTVILKLKRSSANAAGGSPMADRPTVERIKSAIRLGFRHLDTAEMYETEHETGVAIKESIAEGIVKREELFVTTKISSNFIEVRSAIDVSLEKLGLDYVDFHGNEDGADPRDNSRYLLHAPYWAKSDADLQTAWAGMEAVKESGKARSIGVSNYDKSHLLATLATARIPPSINQVEFHPYMSHGDLLAFSRSRRNIATSAYGALTPVTRNIPGPLDETLKSLATRYEVSISLICLRWCLDQDVVVITTSQREDRMAEYLRVFTFKLTKEEVQEIAEKGAQCLKGEELVPRVIRYYNGLKSESEGN